MHVSFGNFAAPAAGVDIVSVTWPGAPKRKLSTISTMGADFEKIAGARFNGVDFAMKLRATGSTRDPHALAMLFKDAVVDKLAPYGDPHDLVLADAATPTDSWRYEGAYVTEVGNLDFRGYAAEAVVRWRCPFGALTSDDAEAVALSISAGSSTAVTPGGDYPPKAYFTGTMTPSGGVCSMTIAGYPFAVELPAARAVTIDFDAHALTVAGVPALPTIQSDWPEFVPGAANAVTMVAGSIDGTLTINDRRL